MINPLWSHLQRRRRRMVLFCPAANVSQQLFRKEWGQESTSISCARVLVVLTLCRYLLLPCVYEYDTHATSRRKHLWRQFDAISNRIKITLINSLCTGERLYSFYDISFLSIKQLAYLSVCVCGHAYAPVSIWASGTTYRDQFSPFIVWVPEIELKLNKAWQQVPLPAELPNQLSLGLWWKLNGFHSLSSLLWLV